MCCRDALSAQRDGHTNIGAPIPVDLDIPSSQPSQRGPGRPLAKKPEASYGVPGGGGAARGRPPSASRYSLLLLPRILLQHSSNALQSGCVES